MKKEEKKQAYILCPRCEINYIVSKDKYCTVCKAELGLLDPSILLPDDEEAGFEKLCPVCQVNYIGEDEEICFLCQKEREEREAAEHKSEWDELDRDDDLDDPIGIIPLEEDTLLSSDDEQEEEDDSEPDKEDDFDYPDFEEEDFEDDDFDDEDEEELEEDDDM